MKSAKTGYHMRLYFVLFLGLTLLYGCNNEDPPSQGAMFLELTVQGNQMHQTIHGFGASDAWSCQFVGKNWPEDKKNQLADWLFSTELDENDNPEGIGLNTWRFNIGGGSALQGGLSGITDEWRRAESFMTGESTFDWDNQQGQRWFLKAAKDRGADQFIGFVNSPPVFLTKNGKAFSSSASSYNLPEENYPEFANYLADVADNLLTNDGIALQYISPFNEPQWDWNSGGQEGTPAQNDEIAAVTKIINQTFADRNITTQLEIPESAQFEFLYKDHTKPGRGNQIDAFFNPDSENYLGGLSHVAPKVAGHSYFSTWPLSSFTEIRKELAGAVNSSTMPVEFWMTEYSILENNAEINGNGRDLGMHTALYAARVILTDLVLANANSWQWWLGVSPYDYKDGLVYIDHNKQDGNIYDSKMLWAMGNFSRFIKAGMVRTGVSRSDFRTIEQSLDGIMTTAFVSEDSSKITIVIINYAQKDIPIKISLNALPEYNNLRHYLTNGITNNNLANQGNFNLQEVYEMPSRSVLTITNQP
jgi:O-glycosyl hydrolase